MGITGLTKLLSDECPECMKEVDLKSLIGRKVAIDASMQMYQFLVAVRSSGQGQAAQMLTNDAGEVTSHIQGMFNRTIRLLAEGIKPVYVFDGRPPTMKGGELAKRLAKRKKAEEDLKTAEESGVVGDVDKYSKRLVKVGRQHNEDCKTLLRLMGVPVVDALSEAEAQCAALAQAGVVYGTATEDMDALTFQTPKLLRRMAASGQLQQAILEVDHEKLLKGLGITQEQFVDICILCGCDYTDSVRGIGPKKALNFIKQYGSIEKMLKHLDKGKYPVPESWDLESLKQLAAAAMAKAKQAKAIKAKQATKIAAAKVEDGDGGGKADGGGGAASGEGGAASGECGGGANASDGAALEAAAPADGAEAVKMEEAAAAAEDAKPAAEGETGKAGDDAIAVDEEATRAPRVATVLEETAAPKGEAAAAVPAAEIATDMKAEPEKEEGAAAAAAATAAAPAAAAKAGAAAKEEEEEEEEEEELAAVEEEEVELIPMYQEARRIFLEPEVYAPSSFDLKWTDPDEEGLTEFLVTKMGFNADRVASGIKRLKDARKLTGQRRMDSFFKPVEAPGGSSSGAKRKPVLEPKGKSKGPATKKGKTTGGKAGNKAGGKK